MRLSVRSCLGLRLIWVVAFLFLPRNNLLFSCTSVIVSGRASADGRPFIFKNGDATDRDAVVILNHDEHYLFLALVSAKSRKPNRTRCGFNEKGFAIINTNASNLNGGRKDNTNNTRIMWRALGVCATLRDFENLLDTLPKPLLANSNFGVMDANGGVAYYETNNKGYVKYDANDPIAAPDGYLIRTNFGVSGDRSLDKGVERYAAMEAYMQQAKKRGKFNGVDVIQGVTRFFIHGQTKENLGDFMPEDDSKRVFVPFQGYIPRQQTATAQLIQGALPGESPLATIGWTICGSPLTTVCVPLWITPEGCLPEMLSRNSDGYATLTHMGLKLKGKLFPNGVGRKKGEINIASLMNHARTGILQRILPIEKKIVRRSRAVRRSVSKGKHANRAVSEYYKWVDEYLAEEYKKLIER